MVCPMDGCEKAFASSKSLDPHLRSSVHNLTQTETETARNRAIQERFSELFGGFPFVDFAAGDLNTVLAKFDNGDMSYQDNVSASAAKDKKGKQSVFNADYRKKAKEQILQQLDNDFLNLMAADGS